MVMGLFRRKVAMMGDVCVLSLYSPVAIVLLALMSIAKTAVGREKGRNENERGCTNDSEWGGKVAGVKCNVKGRKSPLAAVVV